MHGTYELAPLTSTGFWSLAALLAGLLGLSVFIMGKPMTKTSKAVSLGVLLPTILAFGWMFYKAGDSSLIITADMVTLDAPLYGFSLPREEVNLAQARMLSWDEEPGLKPEYRTNGVGMPGFQLGWFSLSSGEKVFMAVTDPRRLILIPTRLGYPIVLSLAEGKRLLESVTKPHLAAPR